MKCPTGKKRHASFQQAGNALGKIWRTGHNKMPIRSYYCHHCKGWHLTSQPYRKPTQ